MFNIFKVFYTSFLTIFLMVSFVRCNINSPKKIIPSNNKSNKINFNPYATIKNIPVPITYSRIENPANSFENWLQSILLKEDKTVYLYNGKKKINQSAQFAVLNISVGDKDLQQCADAVMRLRAEFLFSIKDFKHILFIDNENKMYQFTPPYIQTHFQNYLSQVFGMCGSASLSKQLKSVNNFKEINIGDVIIKGGFPGHAVIVVDMAKNSKGEKIYLLAQSYMPAQDIHILNNPSNSKLSPWYQVKEFEKIITPEYVFNTTDLKKW